MNNLLPFIYIIYVLQVWLPIKREKEEEIKVKIKDKKEDVGRIKCEEENVPTEKDVPVEENAPTDLEILKYEVRNNLLNTKAYKKDLPIKEKDNCDTHINDQSLSSEKKRKREQKDDPQEQYIECLKNNMNEAFHIVFKEINKFRHIEHELSSSVKELIACMQHNDFCNN